MLKLEYRRCLWNYKLDLKKRKNIVFTRKQTKTKAPPKMFRRFQVRRKV